jgi:hypothetical protein
MISGAAPLGNASTGVPRGKSLDHDEPERLTPLDGIEKCGRALQEGQGLGAARLADVGHVLAQQRVDRGLEPLTLCGLSHLRSDAQRHACGPRDACGNVDALVGVHTAEEQQVAAVSAADCHLVGVQPVMDDPADVNSLHRRLDCLRVGDGDDRHATRERAVDVAHLGSERAVARGHHGRRIAPTTDRRAGKGVVVDDVT